MSNRNYLQPNINPTVNPNLKGNVHISGTLEVDGDVLFNDSLTVSDDLNIGDDLVVSGSVSIQENLGIGGNLEATSGTVLLSAGTLVGISSPNLITFGGTIPSIKAAALPAYFVAPRAGTIIGIAACTQAAITTGNAVLTPAINGISITNGAITLPLAGTADGDPGYSTPTGLNIVALNDIIRVAISGTNNTETPANIVFTLQYT